MNNVANALFVYGTLKPGEPAAHLLSVRNGNWQSAQIRAHHFPEGVDGTEGYPAVRLSAQAPLLNGMLLQSAELPALLPSLDDYEGPGYKRVVTPVYTQGQYVCDAHVYVAASD